LNSAHLNIIRPRTSPLLGRSLFWESQFAFRLLGAANVMRGKA